MLPATIYLVFLATALLVAVVAVRRRARRTQATTVVQTLALIVGQNVPLVDALRGAARNEGRRLRVVFQTMARRLEAGDSISTAWRRAYPTCPQRVIGAIRGAEQGGTLPSVLRSLAMDIEHERRTAAQRSPALLYFFVLTFVAGSVLLGIVILLLPKFRAILLDFGVVTHPLYDGVSVVAGCILRLGPLLLAVLGVALVFWAQALWRRAHPRADDAVAWIAVLADTIVWHLPGLRRIAETRALTRQLPILQAAVRAGHDIGPAALQAACVGANLHARRRLRRWAQRIEAGGDPAAEARSLGLPEALRRALTSARGPDELATALDYLCAYYRSLLLHWEEVFASAAIPIVVLVWAVCVALIWMAILMPLQATMDSIMLEAF